MKGTAIISQKFFMKGIVALSAILFFTGAAVAEEQRVMTRNLYLGAEIQSLAASGTLDEFLVGAQAALAQIAANNFPARAEALAAEIIEKKPHLVGLQEVYNYTINGTNGPLPFRDYLEDLLAALAAQGADYRVAAVVRNLDLELDIPGFGRVGIMDRDVILAQGNVPTEVVDLTGYCRASIDGCNFQVIVRPETPIGPIAFERGFVAVDALIGNLPMRFVNTHLEVRNVDLTNPLSPFVQAAQSSELIGILGVVPNPQSAPIIIVGDINSSPEHEIVELPVWPYQIVPPYMQFVSTGYWDAWTLRPGNSKGYTCCQAEDLLNPESILSERIDMIFSDEVPARVKANVVGNDEDDLGLLGLWPSDHAGVAARLELVQ